LASVRYRPSAEADLASIGNYTLRIWGEAQADFYLYELKSCCERLSENPLLGRGCDGLRPGLRRFEQGKHVVFYRHQPDGILVVRILHQRMLPQKI